MQSFAMVMVKEEATVFRVRHVNTLTMSIPTTDFKWISDSLVSFDLFHHFVRNSQAPDHDSAFPVAA